MSEKVDFRELGCVACKRIIKGLKDSDIKTEKIEKGKKDFTILERMVKSGNLPILSKSNGFHPIVSKDKIAIINNGKKVRVFTVGDVEVVFAGTQAIGKDIYLNSIYYNKGENAFYSCMDEV